MIAKQPFLPLFFGDFLASTADWEGEEQALYLLLLGHQWSLGSLPAEPTRVCKLVRWDRRLFERAWPVVSTKFEARDGRLYNARLEEHRDHATEISKKRAVAGSNGAAKRYGKPEAIDKELPQQTGSNSQANATDLLCHPNQTIPNQEEEPSANLRGRGKGSSSLKPLGDAIPKSFSNGKPLSPPQEPQENGHDARSFDTIKENVAALAERLQTQDPERIHKLGGPSHKLSRRQCEEAVKQLREDGFFNRMAIA